MLHRGQLRGIQVGGRRLWRIGRIDLEDYIQDAYRKAAKGLHGERAEISPQLARALQATITVWRRMETEFGLLSPWELAAAVGSAGPDESFASEQRAAGNLIAIKRMTSREFPGFQIDSEHHVIRPVMRDLIAVANEAGRDEESLALWMVSPTGYLNGARPVDRFNTPAAIVEAARQSFNVQW